jgi:rod shape determining protein RodA
VLYVLFSVVDLDILSDQWKPLLAGSVLLISSLFVFGSSGGTVNRAWLRFGPVGIQPSELVKIPYVILLARAVVWGRKRRGLNHISSVALATGLFLSMFLLIVAASDDLGSALVYLFMFLAVMFVSGLKWYWFLGAASIVGAMTPYAWSHLLTQRHRDLILAPYDASIDPSGLGITWQVIKSKQAIAAGGLTGTGLFKGEYTSSGAVPKQYTDFIFSAAGEELGFIGALALLLLLMLLIVRCIWVGLRCNDRQGAVVCFGIAAMLIFQTFENVGMCLGLTPVIGITLPFFSYGGSSVMTVYAAMGIVSGVRTRPAPSRFVRIE